ncbi:MAG: NAD(+) diphosphatase [Ruminococcus sp.]|nr:NAD(+) diphosphatase [Ruminococcus sp.]
MIQDIYPSRLDNSFAPCQPSEGDVLLCFDAEGRLLADAADGQAAFTRFGNVEAGNAVYLFCCGGERYFMSPDGTAEPPEGFEYYTIRELRRLCGGETLFAAFTAYHLWKWYADNRFCGRCGGSMAAHPRERALVCPECGNVVYPRINPAVIVGVIKGDCLLVTRYKRGYAHNALVAGFTEIGETLEQTVEREVMEETGIRVRDIRYYKSQPWGMAQDILAGFFCEADGDDEIRMDEGELKYACWVSRGDIELQPDDLSLTNEMMRVFKENKL